MINVTRAARTGAPQAGRMRSLLFAGAMAIAGTSMLGWSTDADARSSYRNFFECLHSPVTRFDGTIVDAAVATESLSTLVTAVSAAGLVDTLNSAGPFTVFAPTNDAFAAIPQDVLGDLLADPAGQLTQILTYHVIGARIDPRYYFYPRKLPTVNGQSVFINRTRDGSRVNNSEFSCSGVRTSNGLVWIIDSVLAPQFLQAEE